MAELERTERTTIKRLPARGSYDREVIAAILDAGLVCHVGFVVDGQPFVIPTVYVRVGERLYVHGSAASRMLLAARQTIPLCITVTHLDGLVLARSAFHQSVNYRSVVVLGAATEVVAREEKLRALEALIERVAPGRWGEVRGPSEPELRATRVLVLPVTEASAKVRSGGPLDDEEDYALPCWAGVIPLRTMPEAPIPDARLTAGVPVPRVRAPG
jgi:nitroimidazol reductase NimA-like FMN-containing flavoprotein (pyridoxamine 5'-phosphate oxidase superfamily)